MTRKEGLTITVSDEELTTLRSWAEYPSWLRDMLITLFITAKIAEQLRKEKRDP